ncbi:hypothetical protein [Cerasicoccus frondis]|uniref:hypothetical protein n=1 Tax=Cerasicoccus frondis TaxID=490090 RepID=UPI0028527003|nr:hypothetical protein [Cerasicoccus frondis]
MVNKIYSLLLLLGAAFYWTGCSNVDVQADPADVQKIASATTIYLSPEIPVTDGSRAPREGFDKKVLESIQKELSGKGYTLVSDASDAEITMSGSYEMGVVIRNSTSAEMNSGYNTNTPKRRVDYLTLTADKSGTTLWTANAPVILETIPSDVAMLMQSFPESKGH